MAVALLAALTACESQKPAIYVDDEQRAAVAAVKASLPPGKDRITSHDIYAAYAAKKIDAWQRYRADAWLIINTPPSYSSYSHGDEVASALRGIQSELFLLNLR
jgi:hypothetical protein